MLMIRCEASCEEPAMFAKIAKNRNVYDFSRYLRFFGVLCHVNDRSKASCEEPAIFAKIGNICYLTNESKAEHQHVIYLVL